MSAPFEVLPDDEYNRTLISHVHPADWTNPEPQGRYNLVVIGAGTAGLITAAVAAGIGARVALVERHLMGGDCLNVGCVPSKAVIRASRVAAEARRASAFGIDIAGPIEPDFARVMERLREKRTEISHEDSAERYSKELGVDVFLGEARFVATDAVEVGGARLRFARAVIATGARAIAPPIEGLEEVGYLTNETVFNLTERPERMAVIGGGPIGCELAQAFARLGTKVSLLEMGPHVLAREDADGAAIVQRALVRDGVELILDAKIERASAAGGSRRLEYRSADREHTLDVDQILVGAGRAPNVTGLGLESAGVEYDVREGVQIDDRLRTTNKRIFAAGDCCMKWKFTHAADAAAKIVVRNALFRGRQKLSDLVMPWCTYTDPEIAHVGLYAHEAEARGIGVDTYQVPLAKVNRALLDGEDEGFVKLHVKRGTDKLVGATVVAAHAGEMISELTLALVARVGLGTLATVIHPYPTQAEGLKAAANAYMRTRLTPGVKRLFETWLSWSR